MTAQQLLLALLAPGGAAFVLAVARAWSLLRNGTETRERQAVESIASWGERAERRAREQENRADYWHRRAAALEHLLRVAGLDVPAPAPPNEREASP